jgi:hypothetical protein
MVYYPNDNIGIFYCYKNVRVKSGPDGSVINWPSGSKTLDENTFENFELVLKNMRELL